MSKGIADRSAAVTPSDTDTLYIDEGAPHARYLTIGTAGNLNFVDATGNAKVVPVGAGYFWCAVYQVLQTHTTALGITAYY